MCNRKKLTAFLIALGLMIGLMPTAALAAPLSDVSRCVQEQIEAAVPRRLTVFYMDDGGQIVGEETVCIAEDSERVEASDLKLVPKGYKVVHETGVIVPADAEEIRVLVEKIPEPETRKIRVNYVTETGRIVSRENIMISRNACKITADDLTCIPEGYEVVNKDGVEISDTARAIDILVKKAEIAIPEELQPITIKWYNGSEEVGETCRVLVPVAGRFIEKARIEEVARQEGALPQGYQLAELSDAYYINGGEIHISVEKIIEPVDPVDPVDPVEPVDPVDPTPERPHHSGGCSSSIVITFMPADGYTLEAQKGTSRCKDGSVRLSVSSGVIPERMIPNAVRADKFYRVTGWAVEGRNGNLERINLNTYRFQRSTKVYACYDDVWMPYKDMRADRTDWYYKELRDLSIAGIVDGYADGAYHAENQVTWGTALKLIELAAGYPRQAQLPDSNHACSGYLALAKAQGHVTADAVIDLYKPITRLEFAQVTAKALGMKASDTARSFTDTSDADVLALHEAGIIQGYGDGRFGPQDTIKRSHIAAIIWRVNQYQKK